MCPRFDVEALPEPFKRFIIEPECQTRVILFDGISMLFAKLVIITECYVDVGPCFFQGGREGLVVRSCFILRIFEKCTALFKPYIMAFIESLVTAFLQLSIIIPF